MTKRIFISIFGIIVFVRCMASHEFGDYIPYTAFYIAYIAVFGFLMILSGQRIGLRVTTYKKVFILLFLYSVIWTFSNIKALDYTDAIYTLQTSILMLLFTYITCYWIKRLNCLKESIVAIFVGLFTFMILNFIIHIDELNIARAISNFWMTVSDKSYVIFGYKNNNLAGDCAAVVILLSLYILENKEIKLKNKKLILPFVDLIMVLVIIGNSSRSAMLMLLIFFSIYLFWKLRNKVSAQKMIRGLIILGIILFAGVIVYIRKKNNLVDFLYTINRYHFLRDFEALSNSGRWIMGLGNMSGQYFSAGHYMYGVRLNYLEPWYLNVFIKTGIVGSIWMMYIFKILFVALYRSFKRMDAVLGKCIVLAAVYMLIISLFENYLFNSRITSNCLLIIVLTSVDVYYSGIETGKVKDNKIQVVTAKSNVIDKCIFKN